MNNRTDHGFLILADVSGFTAFVTTTELEHGSEIIAALLDEVVEPPLAAARDPGDRGRRGVRARRRGVSPAEDPATRGPGRCLRRLQDAAAGDAGRRDLLLRSVSADRDARSEDGGPPRAVPAAHGGRPESGDRHRGDPRAPAPEERAGAHGRLRAPHGAGAALTRDRRGARPGCRPTPSTTSTSATCAASCATSHPPPSPRWGEGRVRGRPRELHPQAIA